VHWVAEIRGSSVEVHMTRNIGTVDRVLRVVIGLILIALVFTGPKTPWGWIGLIPLFTAFVGWCPLYRVIRISTFRAPRS
jgi:hypothetical protein